MEGMFTDMKLSEDIMVGYRQQRADRGVRDTRVNVPAFVRGATVLT